MNGYSKLNLVTLNLSVVGKLTIKNVKKRKCNNTAK